MTLSGVSFPNCSPQTRHLPEMGGQSSAYTAHALGAGLLRTCLAQRRLPDSRQQSSVKALEAQHEDRAPSGALPEYRIGGGPGLAPSDFIQQEPGWVRCWELQLLLSPAGS